MREIIVFSDFACPFCYIGFKIAQRLSKDYDQLSFSFLPLLLNEDHGPKPKLLTDRIDKESIEAGYQRIQYLASEYKLDYSNRLISFDTLDLNRAGLYAQDQGKYFEFADLAFHYIFGLGKNVAQIEIILEIAARAGLDSRELEKVLLSEDYKDIIEENKIRAKDYSIESLPTFIVDGRKKPTELRPYREFIKVLLEKDQ